MTVHGIAAAVWVTGAVWLAFRYFVRVTDSFGFENVHPQQRWWLIAHAAFSIAAIWMFGVLWPDHVKRGWRMKASRPTGGALFGVIAWLTLSGFALYYIGNDSLRAWTSVLHWAIGLGAVSVFLLHLPARSAE